MEFQGLPLDAPPGNSIPCRSAGECWSCNNIRSIRISRLQDVEGNSSYETNVYSFPFADVAWLWDSNQRKGAGCTFFSCNRKFANVFSPLLYLKSDTNITISISILFIDCYYYYSYQKGCSVSHKSLYALIKHLKINGTSENKLWKESFTSNLWSLLMGFLKLK